MIVFLHFLAYTIRYHLQSLMKKVEATFPKQNIEFFQKLQFLYVDGSAIKPLMTLIKFCYEENKLVEEYNVQTHPDIETRVR